VKNNLQIVTSLLNLRAQSVLSPSARQTMMEAQVRIKALALVHRNLYEQNDVRTIELSTFLRDLCEMLRDILQPETDAEVVLELRAEPTEVVTDQAIPIALIVTEAVSNAFRHAFRAGRGGRVVVDLAREADETVLVIADDGIGMAASGERGDGPGTGPAGVGMTLITMLAKQVGARLAIEQQAGTRITLRFAAAGPAGPVGA
jgi:two-component sensor histidine kinase